ncbi:hypothetical protein EXIGLDRAFT_777893 [Exidia glandulosa HHB12029]|uniref:Uncharacterized protein n=1 Tax=Exidia glandulosa HHB12029 TaxID=1314781 RepID=A0A165CTV6_EXIGL|nr:hypothetical protein EXIGLDRAFT_777893 [Exidia glandulosa HHB12029]
MSTILLIIFGLFALAKSIEYYGCPRYLCDRFFHVTSSLSRASHKEGFEDTYQRYFDMIRPCFEPRKDDPVPAQLAELQLKFDRAENLLGSDCLNDDGLRALWIRYQIASCIYDVTDQLPILLKDE